VAGGFCLASLPLPPERKMKETSFWQYLEQYLEKQKQVTIPKYRQIKRKTVFDILETKND